MSDSKNLKLPFIMAAQAQKHVTHNEAIRALDAIVQLSVADRDLATAPASPIDGSRYIVASSASGEWAGQEQKIAAFQDNAWMFYSPLEGWLAWVSDEDKLLAFDGLVWSEVSGAGAGAGSLNPAPLVGVNTSADSSNRLAVSSANTAEQEAEIQRQIASDPDSWEMTGKVVKRGRPTGATKEQITVRLDKDLLAALQTPDPKGWQTRLNAAVRAGLKASS